MSQPAVVHSTAGKENVSVYYMRVLGILFIINAHFTGDNITNFDNVALYGSLGFIGNMIFFFISAYVLTLSFPKYRKTKLRWLWYRLIYLALTIVILRTIFNFLEGTSQNIIELLELNDVGFISIMFMLSVLFPLLWSLSKKTRIVLFSVSYSFCLAMAYYYNYQPDKWTGMRTLLEVLDYLNIFLLGIVTANREIRFGFKSAAPNILLAGASASVYIIVKSGAFDYFAYTFSRYCFIYYLFFSLETVRMDRAPKFVTTAIKTIALLSLFIYITHTRFGFINLSYQLNKYIAPFILILIITPICMVEKTVLDQITLKIKKFILPSVSRVMARRA